MNVLIVDDHPLIVSALQTMMEGLRPEVRVQAAGTAQAARAALVDQVNLDLLMLDLQLDELDGFVLLAEVREAHPALPVVVLADADRPDDVVRAIELGAMGFLPKRLSMDALADALQLVMAGGLFVPSMQARPAEAMVRLPEPAPSPVAAAVSFESLGLTPRQAEVLALLLQGQANKEIARRLNLSVETVKDHVQAVLRALGVNSRTQAVLAVAQMNPQPLPMGATQIGL